MSQKMLFMLVSLNHRDKLSNFVWFFPGTSYDNEQELHAHPSGLPDNEMDETGYFERLGAKTESFLERFFTVWGTYCASNPWKVLLGGELRFLFLYLSRNERWTQLMFGTKVTWNQSYLLYMYLFLLDSFDKTEVSLNWSKNTKILNFEHQWQILNIIDIKFGPKNNRNYQNPKIWTPMTKNCSKTTKIFNNNDLKLVVKYKDTY